MDREPARGEDQFGRDGRHGLPRPGPEQGELDAGEDVARLRPPCREHRLARADHVRRVGRIADHLERVIGLDRRADVELTVVIERPAVMFARLAAAQIGRDPGFERCVDRLAEIVAQQDIFRRDRRVGLQLEDPVPIRLLARGQGIGGFADCRVEGIGQRHVAQFLKGNRSHRGAS